MTRPRSCRGCGYLLPITMGQVDAVAAEVEGAGLRPDIRRVAVSGVRRAMWHMGVCAWRCELVRVGERRRCEHWWRYE